VKQALAFVIFSSLLVTACDNRDAKLRKEIAGAWTHEDSDSSGVMILASDSSFKSKWTLAFSNTAREWTCEGTWIVKDGFLVATITNSTAKNSTHTEPVGSIDRLKIIAFDGHHLGLDVGSQTNLFERRR
jgi:hypothetical protein